VGTALVLCRFVHFSLVLTLFGAWVFRPLLWRGEASPVDRSLARWTPWLATLALISGVGWLMLVTASMTGEPSAAFSPATLSRVLGKTLFGEVWRWHLLFNGLLLALLCTPWRDRVTLNIGLSGLLLLTLAPVGHGAMLDGLGGQLLMLNQALHLACAGGWLGGLLLLVTVLQKPAGQSISRLLRRFSGVGYVLVAGVLLTGLINVRVLTGAFWPTPLLSGFALILLIKAALVATMLGLALFNRLRSNDGEQRLSNLRTSVTLEWLLGLGAVAAVSLLGTLPPMIG